MKRAINSEQLKASSAAICAFIRNQANNPNSTTTGKAATRAESAKL
jgi:hypothetical protein